MSDPSDPGSSRDLGGGLTRRGLFRSIGTATLVAGCVKQDPPPTSPEQTSSTDLDGAFGLEPAPLEFTLDGELIQTKAEARTTLLELLRLDLDRTGTKVVCDRGACGACMVLVDKIPRNSCMLLAHDVAGAEVTTATGIGTHDALSDLQRAFVEHDALQCGFCTSGMLVSASAVHERDAAELTRAQVEEATAGNLCRCGTYPHVVDAVMSVARGETGRRHQAELIAVKTKKGGA